MANHIIHIINVLHQTGHIHVATIQNAFISTIHVSTLSLRGFFYLITEILIMFAFIPSTENKLSINVIVNQTRLGNVIKVVLSILCFYF